MKTLYLLAALALTGLLTGPMTGCSNKETAGEYIDDSTISNTIRAKLIDDKELNVFKIDITTLKGVVTLTGNVSSAAAKARATTVASGVKGVKSVQNNLAVK